MLIAISKKTDGERANWVYGVHEESQLEEVLSAYPADHQWLEVRRTASRLSAGQPLPEDVVTTLVERTVA